MWNEWPMFNATWPQHLSLIAAEQSRAWLRYEEKRYYLLHFKVLHFKTLDRDATVCLRNVCYIHCNCNSSVCYKHTILCLFWRTSIAKKNRNAHIIMESADRHNCFLCFVFPFIVFFYCALWWSQRSHLHAYCCSLCKREIEIYACISTKFEL